MEKLTLSPEKRKSREILLEKLKEVHRYIREYSVVLLALYTAHYAIGKKNIPTYQVSRVLQGQNVSRRHVEIRKGASLTGEESSFTKEKKKGSYLYYQRSLMTNPKVFKKILKNDENFLRNVLITEGVAPQDYLLRADREELEEFLNEDFIERVFTDIQEQIRHYDQEIAQLEKNVQSETFLNRLTYELDGDRESAKRLQREMLTKLEESKNYFMGNHPNFVKDYTLAFAIPEQSSVVLPYKPKEGSSLATHEYTHIIRSVRVKLSLFKKLLGIPRKTASILKEKYQRERMLKLAEAEEREVQEKYGKWENRKKTKKRAKERVRYLQEPTEILARMAVLREEARKNGIEIRDGRFGEQHYQQIIQLLYEGKLSRDAREFLQMYSKEDLIYIMNHVATLEKTKSFYENTYKSLVGAHVPKRILEKSEREKGTYYHPQWYEIDSWEERGKDA